MLNLTLEIRVMPAPRLRPVSSSQPGFLPATSLTVGMDVACIHGTCNREYPLLSGYVYTA